MIGAVLRAVFLLLLRCTEKIGDEIEDYKMKVYIVNSSSTSTSASTCLSNLFSFAAIDKYSQSDIVYFYLLRIGFSFLVIASLQESFCNMICFRFVRSVTILLKTKGKARIGGFRGWFTIEAVEHVCN